LHCQQQTRQRAGLYGTIQEVRHRRALPGKKQQARGKHNARASQRVYEGLRDTGGGHYSGVGLK